MGGAIGWTGWVAAHPEIWPSEAPPCSSTRFLAQPVSPTGDRAPEPSRAARARRLGFGDLASGEALRRARARHTGVAAGVSAGAGAQAAVSSASTPALALQQFVHIPLCRYPFLNTTSTAFEYLRLTSLGVIDALIKISEI